ncbi:MAG: peptide chain release factor N(5)-glutamine methyltransferase [Ignavibacteriales bacterium]|nr:peptide chain release factor N(5)-glutamine methyltransferase [Ignavibacteriales bacterium]
MTVLEGIQLTTDYLDKKGIDSPRINAEIMLAHILKCKRLDLYLSFDKPLKDEEIKVYREFLKRRSSFEPLQYILGSVEFYGLEFMVNKSVLIPRQETEILIETILNYFPKENKLSFLDIGTGSGNIAICLAKLFPESTVTTIDISPDSINLAKENEKLNNLDERIKFVNADIKDFNPENNFDVIVSNPPYVSINEYKTLQPEIVNYEPANAISDFGNGLKFYELISEKANLILNKPGYLFFEVGKGQHSDVKIIFEKNNFRNVIVKKDFLNIERVVYGELV